MTLRFDLIIVGGGSAAFAAATRANDIGAETAMVNQGELGGTCVNVGCVPSKHLLEVASRLRLARGPRFDAIGPLGATFSFEKALEGKRKVVEGLRISNYRRALERMPKVTLYEGRGALLGRSRVRVGGETLEGGKILVAVGARPHIPPFDGVEEAGVLTSEGALELDELPESLVVVGGRALALEFAQIFSRFGSKVTVLQRSPRILPDDEPEVSAELAENLAAEGIDIHTGVEVRGLEKKGGARVVRCSIRGAPRDFEAEQVLMATGRRPDLEGLGLEAAGVEAAEGFIKVDEFMQTTNPDVYAAGDCASRTMLETLAARMGHLAARNALEGARLPLRPREFPRAVFTDPQIASVGYTEEEYHSATGACACRVLDMEAVPRAQVVEDTRGVIKMVADPRSLRVVGVHIVAPSAAEMIQEACLAFKHGLTVDDIVETPHVFPTATEAVKWVAHAFRRDVSAMSCCIM